MPSKRAALGCLVFLGIGLVGYLVGSPPVPESADGSARPPVIAVEAPDVIARRSFASEQQLSAERVLGAGGRYTEVAGGDADTLVWYNPVATNRRMAAGVADGALRTGGIFDVSTLRGLGFTGLEVVSPQGRWSFPVSTPIASAPTRTSQRSLAGRMYVRQSDGQLLEFESGTRMRSQDPIRGIERGTYSVNGEVLVVRLDGVGGLEASFRIDANGIRLIGEDGVTMTGHVWRWNRVK